MTDLADATRASRRGRMERLRQWDAPRGVLLLLCLLVLVAGFSLGARESSYADLQARVADGGVDTVTIHGESLGPRSTGFTTLHMTWRDGPVPRVAEVVETRRADGPRSDMEYDGDAVVVEDSVAADLLAIDPDLAVVREPSDLRHDVTALGWAVPGWMAWTPIALLLGALVLVARRTEPWRATRWGWRWPILLVPVLGALAYAAFSGPGLSPVPRDGARRLTGGWSFLLFVVVLSALQD